VDRRAGRCAACRPCRPTGPGSAPPGQLECAPRRPSRASWSTCMASRMAPSVSRSRSAGVISPRSACSRKIAQTCWSSASTVSTVITVPTSIPGIPPRMPGRVRGFGPHRGLPYCPWRISYRTRACMTGGTHPRHQLSADGPVHVIASPPGHADPATTVAGWHDDVRYPPAGPETWSPRPPSGAARTG
jgi:hypothetical protein